MKHMTTSRASASLHSAARRTTASLRMHYSTHSRQKRHKEHTIRSASSMRDMSQHINHSCSVQYCSQWVAACLQTEQVTLATAVACGGLLVTHSVASFACCVLQASSYPLQASRRPAISLVTKTLLLSQATTRKV